MWRRILSPDFMVTKRQLGALMMVVGAAALAATAAIDHLRDSSGQFGTTQQLITAVAVMAVVVGITLLPLGDRPA